MMAMTMATETVVDDLRFRAKNCDVIRTCTLIELWLTTSIQSRRSKKKIHINRFDGCNEKMSCYL